MELVELCVYLKPYIMLTILDGQGAHWLLKAGSEWDWMAKCFSYEYCTLTLWTTSEIFGTIVDFHLEVIVNLAAINIWVTTFLKGFGKLLIVNERRANWGVGNTDEPVVAANSLKTVPQKPRIPLQSHNMWKMLPLEPHCLQQELVSRWKIMASLTGVR